MQYLQALPTLLAILLLAFLGFLVTHNQYRKVNVLFLLLIIADSAWLSGVFAINFTPYRTSVFLGRVVYATSICLALCALAFIDSLLGVYRSARLKWLLFVGSGALLLLTLFTPLIIKGITLSTFTTFLAAFPIYGSWYWLFILYLAIALVAIFIPLFHRQKPGEGSVTKQQLTYARFGLAAFAILSVLTNLVLPSFFGSPWPSMFAPVGSIVLALAFFYAIGRYKLFDVRFVVLRAAAYLTTVFIVTFVFITPFVLIINRLLGQAITGEQFALVVLSSVVLLYVLQFLRTFFDKFTVAVFSRNFYDTQDVLDNLSGVLVRTADLKNLRENTAQVLRDALRPSFLRYILFADANKQDAALGKVLDDYSWTHKLDILDIDEIDKKHRGIIKLLRDDGVMIAIRLHTTHEDLGFMIVGYKQSGDAYVTRDKRLLSIAADEIAISLQNMLRFEQIQRFNTTLQGEVDSATQKLRRQNKRLEELDDVKDDFISMASHQLRTPLTSVKGYLSMVLEGDAGKLNSTQTQMLKQSFASSQRMVFLITDLLNVSRLKTGKFVIDTAPTKLDEVVSQELDQLHETARVKNIELSFEKPKAFPELMLDEVKIRQVIMNFVDNAIYYTPDGGHIKVELVDKPTVVELRVIDDGIGVPKSEQHHLFTKFYRATNARKARPDGTGLGLFMAQKVILAQGGSTIFSSQENKGSTFGFAFSKSRLAVKSVSPHTSSLSAAPAVQSPRAAK